MHGCISSGRPQWRFIGTAVPRYLVMWSQTKSSSTTPRFMTYMSVDQINDLSLVGAPPVGVLARVEKSHGSVAWPVFTHSSHSNYADQAMAGSPGSP